MTVAAASPTLSGPLPDVGAYRSATHQGAGSGSAGPAPSGGPAAAIAPGTGSGTGRETGTGTARPGAGTPPAVIRARPIAPPGPVVAAAWGACLVRLAQNGGPVATPRSATGSARPANAGSNTASDARRGARRLVCHPRPDARPAQPPPPPGPAPCLDVAPLSPAIAAPRPCPDIPAAVEPASMIECPGAVPAVAETGTASAIACPIGPATGAPEGATATPPAPAHPAPAHMARATDAADPAATLGGVLIAALNLYGPGRPSPPTTRRTRRRRPMGSTKGDRIAPSPAMPPR
ncbi:hypothetical protein EV659_101500 [Rhodothalassium salexigens DSM 2132]|uniref:Uncharacterized protein n=1 Tax=Rhodothalassium salexigens DSM 2132 TaxID=1188247 RepID=A0A4R2PRR5_RHOSA|nr:hypothetical protein [Rhodothalassium salexigens DSM 2132]TCP38593.1 hypothetical protein EV659_101500 [Rhodothalassium salexigens DSM 2132]